MFSGATCSFSCNASGPRVKKQYNDPGSGNADTIYYVYDGINPIAEYASDGSLLARYVYAGGLHIAKIAGADTSWYHGDALGSTRKMTKEDGTAYDWSATYYPFGEMTQTGAGSNTHGFTGKEYDTEMGLNYFCLRYYDPQIGRFMTLDPFGGYVELPQSQNRYAYVMNNPLKYIDPLGLQGEPQTPLPEDAMYVWWKGGWVQIGYGTETRATLSDFQRLCLMSSGLLGMGGMNPEDMPIPQLEKSIEDIIRKNLGLFPGFRIGESGDIERIMSEQGLSDRPVAMPAAPGYGSTPASVMDVWGKYQGFMKTQYAEHHSTFPPFGYWYWNEDTWACDAWSSALTEYMKSQKNLPGWDFVTIWLHFSLTPPLAIRMTGEFVYLPGYFNFHSVTIGISGSYMIYFDPYVEAPLKYGNVFGFAP